MAGVAGLGISIFLLTGALTPAVVVVVLDNEDSCPFWLGGCLLCVLTDGGGVLVRPLDGGRALQETGLTYNKDGFVSYVV